MEKGNARKEITIRLRVTKETARLIKIRALNFFEGNLSEFIRHAAENFRKPLDERKNKK